MKYFYFVLEGRLVRSALFSDFKKAEGAFFRFTEAYPTKQFGLGKLPEKDFGQKFSEAGLEFRQLPLFESTKTKSILKDTSSFSKIKENFENKVKEKVANFSQRINDFNRANELIEEALNKRPKCKAFLAEHRESYTELRDKVLEIKNNFKAKVVINDYLNAMEALSPAKPGLVKRVKEKIKKSPSLNKIKKMISE